MIASEGGRTYTRLNNLLPGDNGSMGNEETSQDSATYGQYRFYGITTYEHTHPNVFFEVGVPE